MVLVGAAASAAPAPAPAPAKNPRVVLETSKGKIVIELEAAKAPKSTENFLSYVRAGFYDGTIFHRVIADFMIQGGGFTADMTQKQAKAPIQNEADNGLKNDKYTVAMARTNDPHSASSQFFINTGDKNAFLNHKEKSLQGWGYAVFGKVVEGFDVVEAIGKTPTTTKSGFQDVPADTVTIKKATVQK
ncbi:MAG TPA: peptidylprolyl isomerase [Thermoanaerobaculia bacterium]|nr:peptidylprolyl isomerase [Thermoanaerobaculia bacterium]